MIDETIHITHEMLQQVITGNELVRVVCGNQQIVGCDQVSVRREGDELEILLSHQEKVLFTLGPYRILDGQTFHVLGNEGLRLFAAVRVITHLG